jgi:hypothetical protein
LLLLATESLVTIPVTFFILEVLGAVRAKLFCLTVDRVAKFHLLFLPWSPSCMDIVLPHSNCRRYSSRIGEHKPQNPCHRNSCHLFRITGVAVLLNVVSVTIIRFVSLWDSRESHTSARLLSSSVPVASPLSLLSFSV